MRRLITDYGGKDLGVSATSPHCWFSILASVTEISKTGFNSSGHIDLVEEISRQSDIRSAARLLLAALSQVYV